MRAQMANRQRISYFLGYFAAALLIAFLIMGILYARSLGMVNAQYQRLAQETVKSQQQMLDRVFLELEQIAMQIDSDASLSNYRIASAGYDAYQAMKQLQRYVAANDFLRDVAFLFSDGSILSSAGSFGRNDFYRRYQLDGVEELYQALLQGESKETLRLYHANTQGLLLVAFTQPALGLPKTRQLLFLLEKTRLDALFSTALQENAGEFKIIDKEGNVFYHYSADALSGDAADTQVGSAVESERIPVRYVYRYDAEKANQSIRALKNSFFQTILLAMLAALLVSALMSSMNFRPVRRLMALVPSAQDAEPEKLADVESYMLSVMENNVRLAQELQSYKLLTRDYALLQTLLGRADSEQLMHLLSCTGVTFQKAQYTVFRFLLNAFRLDEGSMTPLCSRAKARRLISAAGALFGQAETVEWYDASFILLVNHDGLSDTAAVFHAVYERLSPFCAMTGGCGGAVAWLDQVQFSLYEALSASEVAHFRLLPFLDAARAGHIVPGESSLRLPSETKLLDATLANDTELMRELIASCKEEWIEKCADANCLRIQTLGFINRLTATLKDTRLDNFAVYVQELLNDNTLDAYAQTLDAICTAAGHKLSGAHAGRLDPLLKRVTSYIEENFSKPELTVPMIADRLNMSASYMTRLMREKMDVSPSKYIEKCRMDRAKKLLSSSSAQVKEVAVESGYLDASSFVRKFKNETGMTPVQYRRLSVRHEEMRR